MSAMLYLPIPSVTTSQPPMPCGNAAPSKQARRTRPNLSKFCQKTKMCSYYLRGACTRDNGCNFAHDPSEIQAKPDLSGTKMCPSMLSSGHCPRMATCKFAHREEDLKRIDIEVPEAPEPPGAAPQDNTKTDVRSASIKTPLSPMPMPRRSRTSTHVATRLNDAAVSGALTLGEMVVQLTSIFSAIYEERFEFASRVGVTAHTLAQVTAEQAWVDAGLNSDSRLSFEEFTHWCSLADAVAAPRAPLTSDVLLAKSQNNWSALSSDSSTIDSDARSQCSTDDGEGSSLASMSSPCRSTSGWRTPAGSEDLDDDAWRVPEITVLNTFIHFSAPDLSNLRRRSSSVPSPVSRAAR